MTLPPTPSGKGLGQKAGAQSTPLQYFVEEPYLCVMSGLFRCFKRYNVLYRFSLRLCWLRHTLRQAGQAQASASVQDFG